MKTISPEEFKKLYGEVGLSQLDASSNKENQTYGQDAISDVKQTISGYKNAAAERNTNIEASNQAQAEGKQGAFRTGFQKLGQVFGFGADIINETVKGAAKTILPQQMEDNAKSNLKTLVDNPVVRPVIESDPVQSMIQKYETIKADNPALARDIDAIFGFTELAANFVGAEALGVGGKVAKQGLKEAGQIVKEGTEGAVNAIDGVLSNATKYPKEIVNKITDTKINQQTKSILEKTNVEKFDRYVKAGEEALKSGEVLTPLEQAGETANNLLPKMKEVLGNLGKQKAATLESVGSTKAPDVTTAPLAELQAFRQGKLTKSERNLVTSAIEELEALGKNPTVQSVDATVDRLQSTLFEQKGGTSIPVTSRTQSVVNKAIRDLNEKNKSFVDGKLGSDDYSKLNLEWRNRNKIYQELNKRLGEDGNRGGSLLKRFFSPQDSGTKKLFADIQKYYGVNLAEDATIAKFVMDTLGDVRARSLLELPPLSKTGIVQKGLDLIEKKITSPKRIIKRARSQIKP
jgi:hypothetical protein